MGRSSVRNGGTHGELQFQSGFVRIVPLGAAGRPNGNLSTMTGVNKLGVKKEAEENDGKLLE
jgi:hypothetical protein